MGAPGSTKAVLLAGAAGALVSFLVASSLGRKPAADPEEGRNLFASFCARCHGRDGAGGLPLFPGGPAPRNFHDHAFHVARNDEQLKRIVVNGKGAAMPSFGAAFTDAQLTALVTHLRSLDSK